ncbi:MAG: NAD(P)H-dependent oxidoreductase subunit E, partial [Hyphomicrobiaceae bacterium]
MSDKPADRMGAVRARSVHPGAGRRSAPLHPKGRVLQPAELDAARRIVGPGPYERPLLIEYLHLIQDAEGCLPAGLMHGLAELMRIPMAEVYEVATFYAHFDVVPDGATRPPRVTVRVCDSLSCMLAGADRLLEELQAEALPEARVVRAPCLGSCNSAPAAHVGHAHVDNATFARLKEMVMAGDVHVHVPDYCNFHDYR